MIQASISQAVIRLEKPNFDYLASEIRDGVRSGILGFVVLAGFFAMFLASAYGVKSVVNANEDLACIFAAVGVLYCLAASTAAIRFAMKHHTKALIALGFVSAAVTGAIWTLLA